MFSQLIFKKNYMICSEIFLWSINNTLKVQLTKEMKSQSN